MTFQWDNSDMTVMPDGTLLPKNAVSDKNGVKLEMSMHDGTIQTLLPKSHWLPVFTANIANAKIDRIAGSFIVLAGFGTPDDPAGNLMFFRITTVAPYSPARLAEVISHIVCTLAGL